MHRLLHLSLAAAAAAPAAAHDWPEFRGPNRDGRVEAVDTDYAWGEDGPEILWKVDVGPGYGGAAILGWEVYLLDRVRGEADVLRVFDLETGELLPERWRNWLEHDPIRLVGRYRRNLSSLRGIYLDCGWRDQYRIHYGARILAARSSSASNLLRPA